MAEEYTVDVWAVQQYSTTVTAASEEEAENIARMVIDDEYWPEEIQEVRVL